MTVFIAGRTSARVFHAMTGKNPSEKKYRGNDLHMGKTVRYLAGADDLIQLIGRKVIVGKNITT
jgi:hypothetical protein